ncbi:hypothetical protein pb186bvf_015723 [Paramecium bursaria]
MMDDNQISLMERYPVSQKIDNAPNLAQGTINRYVIQKVNDQNNIDLQTLRTNQQIEIYTRTPVGEWLTFEFIRKERIMRILGQLFNDDRIYMIECQYLNHKKQWITNFWEDFQQVLDQNIFPPIGAYGLRFRGRSNIDLNLQFNNLNIFAKKRLPYLVAQNLWEKVNYLHDKYEIVNILDYQPFYQKINNLVVSYNRAVVTNQIVNSSNDIDSINDNKNQDIFIQSLHPNWITLEFYKKFKLLKIEVQPYIKDKRKWEYDLEVMDKQKTWKQIVVAGKTGYKPIEIDFINFFPSYGVRIRGKSNVSQSLLVVSIKILAQRGKPIEIQNI